MTYAQAVELAKRNEEAGYQFLYESTYRDKYYIALKYMKNEEDALDVLQDAYVKAFDKLDTLYETEKFPAWLGMIVANTAKNALAKKKPVLFSDMSGENEDGDAFEYQIEDENIGNQPELSYTKEETRELVQQLIDSLSEEQRLCILMFHMEDMSIREIAETLDCSENTVKSRLNYGRKNLKTKAEELEKQGYKLYGIAPLPLLLYLLRVEGSLYQAGANIAQMLSFQKFVDYFNNCRQAPNLSFAGNRNPLTGPNAFNGNGLSSGPTLPGGVDTAGMAANMAGKAAKQAFIHTVAGKITAAVIAVVIAAGVTIAVIRNKPSEDTDTAITTGSEENTQKPSETETTDTNAEATDTDAQTTAQTTETTEADADIPMKDEDYGNLTGLTKEEMTAMLAYASSEYSGGGMTDEDIKTFLSHLLYSDGMKLDLGETTTADYRSQWNTETINKMLSVMEIPEMTEENAAYWVEKGFQVSGNTVSQVPPTPNDSYMGDIVSAVYNAKQMQITYVVTTKINHHDERGTEESTEIRTAIFVPNADGKYVLSQITQETEKENENEDENSGSEADWKFAYAAVINDPASWLRDTQNVDASLFDGLSNYQYALFDMNQDGTPELIISASTSDNFVEWFFCTYSVMEGVYMIVSQEWNFMQSLVICNNQLAWYYYDRYSQDVILTAISMTPNEISNSDEIYSGAMESAPKVEELKKCPVEDESYIFEYTAG